MLYNYVNFDDIFRDKHEAIFIEKHCLLKQAKIIKKKLLIRVKT